MRYVVLNSNNIVENVISAEYGFTIPDKVLIETELGNIGDLYDDGVFISEEERKTLSEIKKEKLNRLEKLRYEKEIAGVVYDGNTYDTSRESQPKYIAIFILATNDPNYVVNWKTKDGVFVTLTSTQVIALSNAVQNHVQNVFNIEKNYTDQINNCSTKEEISDIDITQGW